MNAKILSIPAFLLALASLMPASAQITMGELSKQQRDSIIFAFPACTSGTMYMQDGSIAKEKFNYNYYEPQLLFINREPTAPEDTLRRFDNLAAVSVVEIGDRTFVPVLGGLGEIIFNDKANNVSLVISKKVNIEEKKTGAYGTGGSTSSIRSVSSFTGASGVSSSGYTGQSNFTSVNYDFDSNAELSVDIRLFLLKGTKIIPVSKKNLAKMYPKAEDFIKKYFDEQKPDIENPQDVINLMNLARTNAQ